MTSVIPPPITLDTLATPKLIETWAEAFDECGGGTVQEFAEWLLLNAKAGESERRYIGRMTLGLNP